MKSFGDWMRDMAGSIQDASEIKDKQEEVLFNTFIERSFDQEAVSLGAKLVNKYTVDTCVSTYTGHVLDLPKIVYMEIETQPYDDDLATYMCSTVVFRQALTLPPITKGYLNYMLEVWENSTEEERQIAYEGGLEDLESLLS